MFESRPDKLRKQAQQIETLTTRLSEMGFLVAQQQADLADQLNKAEQAIPPYAELCDLLECAEDKRVRIYAQLAEFDSALALERFCTKGMEEHYRKLLSILKNNICLCEKQIADLQFQLLCLVSEGVELEVEQCTLELQEMLDANPVTDWKCQRFIEEIIGDASIAV